MSSPAQTDRGAEHEERPRGKTDLAHVLAAARYSLVGFAATARHEDAFCQELIRTAVRVPLALWLRRDSVARALLVGNVPPALVVELLNSAIETAASRISLDNHRLAKRAKDLDSAAVMLSLVAVVAIWLLMLVG